MSLGPMLFLALAGCGADSDGARDQGEVSEPPTSTTATIAYEVDASCSTDEFGITYYRGIIKNVAAEPAGFSLEVAFRRDGAIIDTHTTYVDTVPAGGEATFKAGTEQEKGSPVECELVRVAERP